MGSADPSFVSSMLATMDEESDASTGRKVGYIWSKEYEEICDYLPSNIGRVYSLSDGIVTPVFSNSFSHPRI
jgi:hypothetical protein